jgi:hypothetical protein
MILVDEALVVEDETLIAQRFACVGHQRHSLKWLDWINICTHRMVAFVVALDGGGGGLGLPGLAVA